ncbi:uncharacterized protein TNCV_4111621 [Trichonephila clavipes]|nr:uncharacterized protein TNCV_4111621 [Trichonephila clavipes]
MFANIFLWSSGTAIPDLELKLKDLLIFEKQPKLHISFLIVSERFQTAFVRDEPLLRNLSTPSRRNKEKFQQLTGRIINLREGGFSYRAKGARVQLNSSTVMRLWKQGTEQQRTTRKASSERRKETSARDDRHLLHMPVNARTASSRQHIGLLLHVYLCRLRQFVNI